MDKEIKKIELGGGENPRGEGFINIDARPLPTVDIIADIRELPFENESIEEIFTTNVLEHFSFDDVVRILQECFRVLKMGGKITIIVPDFEKIVELYKNGNVDFKRLNMWLYGSQNYSYAYHRICWDFRNLKDILSNTGFTRIEKVPYSYKIDYLGCPMLQVIAVKEKQSATFKGRKKEIIWNKTPAFYDRVAGKMGGVRERIVPHSEEKLNYLLHLRRYEFAIPYARDKYVLDVGCGTGYGFFLLSGWAKKVFAFDISKDAIDFASSHYKRENLTFSCMDWKGLKNMNRKFDLIVSFEFIEHIEETDAFLALTKNVMNDNATMLLSTPNKSMSLGSNPFHCREFNPEELKNILSKYFGDITLYGEFIRDNVKEIMKSQEKIFEILLRYLKTTRIVLAPLRYLRRKILFKKQPAPVVSENLFDDYRRVTISLIGKDDILITSSQNDVWRSDYLLAVCRKGG